MHDLIIYKYVDLQNEYFLLSQSDSANSGKSVFLSDSVSVFAWRIPSVIFLRAGADRKIGS